MIWYAVTDVLNVVLGCCARVITGFGVQTLPAMHMVITMLLLHHRADAIVKTCCGV